MATVNKIDWRIERKKNKNPGEGKKAKQEESWKIILAFFLKGNNLVKWSGY